MPSPSLLRLPAFRLFAGSWLAALAVLAWEGRSLVEPLVLCVLLGLLLPGLALLVCRGLPALAPDRPRAGERPLLVALVVLVAVALAVKGPLLELVTPATGGRRYAVVNLLFKLTLFVALPLLLYARRLGIGPRALGLVWPPGAPGTGRRSAVAFLLIGALFVAIQLLLGRGARPLLDGSLATHHWMAGIVLCWLWESVEAGVVEELFFRVLLQSRLAALSGSQGAGLFASALVFGLAHAPGLWLRGAGVIEGLGAAPSLLLAIATSVTTMAVAGLVFGVLWLRTRNWLLVVLLHGLVDALSNAPEFIARWGL